MLAITRDALKVFWHTNKAMTLFLFANFGFLALGILGLLFDPRRVLNAPTWAKDVKFSISLLFYTATMLWMFSYINLRPRLKSFVLTASAILLFVEMLMIVFQAARAVPMHFNVSTPLDAALWSAMSVSIMAFYGINIIGFILFFRQPLPDRTLAWSLKLGMLIMLVGFGIAFLMTGPSASQMASSVGAISNQGFAESPLQLIGAHTVGAPDGGPGLPLLGWSTTYGDLRIAHFIGLHGPQALALFGFALILFSRRPNNRLSQTHRLAMVAGAFVAYLGIVLLVTWQALRMQSVITPDALTLSVFAALVLSFVVYNALVIRHAYRPRSQHSRIAAAATLR